MIFDVFNLRNRIALGYIRTAVALVYHIGMHGLAGAQARALVLIVVGVRQCRFYRFCFVPVAAVECRTACRRGVNGGAVLSYFLQNHRAVRLAVACRLVVERELHVGVWPDIVLGNLRAARFECLLGQASGQRAVIDVGRAGLVEHVECLVVAAQRVVYLQAGRHHPTVGALGHFVHVVVLELDGDNRAVHFALGLVDHARVLRLREPEGVIVELVEVERLGAVFEQRVEHVERTLRVIGPVLLHHVGRGVQVILAIFHRGVALQLVLGRHVVLLQHGLDAVAISAAGLEHIVDVVDGRRQVLRVEVELAVLVVERAIGRHVGGLGACGHNHIAGIVGYVLACHVHQTIVAAGARALHRHLEPAVAGHIARGASRTAVELRVLGADCVQTLGVGAEEARLVGRTGPRFHHELRIGKVDHMDGLVDAVLAAAGARLVVEVERKRLFISVFSTAGPIPVEVEVCYQTLRVGGRFAEACRRAVVAVDGSVAVLVPEQESVPAAAHFPTIFHIGARGVFEAGCYCMELLVLVVARLCQAVFRLAARRADDVVEVYRHRHAVRHFDSARERLAAAHIVEHSVVGHVGVEACGVDGVIVDVLLAGEIGVVDFPHAVLSVDGRGRDFPFVTVRVAELLNVERSRNLTVDHGQRQEIEHVGLLVGIVTRSVPAEFQRACSVRFQFASFACGYRSVVHRVEPRVGFQHFIGVGAVCAGVAKRNLRRIVGLANCVACIRAIVDAEGVAAIYHKHRPFLGLHAASGRLERPLELVFACAGRALVIFPLERPYAVGQILLKVKRHFAYSVAVPCHYGSAGLVGRCHRVCHRGRQCVSVLVYLGHGHGACARHGTVVGGKAG